MPSARKNEPRMAITLVTLRISAALLVLRSCIQRTMVAA